MKQVIAIIRDECVELTLAALAQIGITGIVVVPVMGRGQQKGAPVIPDQDGTLGRNAGLHLRRPGTGMVWPAYRPPQKKKAGFGFLPKQMLMVLASDDDAGPVVQALIAVNKSGRHGDGKIFVCPIGRAF
jgi:nitrogen regulatory protein PII 2